MKKLLFTLIAVIGLASMASAQLYVGGSIGFSSDGGKTKLADGTEIKHAKTAEFGLMPRVGYFLNDNLSVGAILNISYTKDTDAGADPYWESMTSLGIAPFVRWNFYSIGKFGINLEGGFGFDYGTGNYKDKPSNTKFSGTNFGLFVRPVLTYDISRNITLEANLNFFGLEYNTTSTTVKVGDDKASTTNNNFGIGANADNVFNVGAITVGFIYKF